MKQTKQNLKIRNRFLIFMMAVIFNLSWGQQVTTVTGNETYTISLNTSLTTPANIRSAAHYQVTNSGTNYLNHAIQTALNAGYTKIYIEEGTYIVTAPINFYKSSLGTNSKPLLSGITIEGAGKGTIIKPYNAAVGHIFNLGAFQLAGTEKLKDSYCENNIIQNLSLDLDSKIKTGIRIGGRGQYNIINNIWIQNAVAAATESYKTSYVSDEYIEKDEVVQKTEEITATVATGAGAIYVELPVDVPFFNNTAGGFAYEADFNKLNNIFIRNCEIGISFNFKKDTNKESVFNANTFENVTIEWFKTAVDFGAIAATCNNNVFTNFNIQPDKIKNQFVFRRIHGDRNVLTNINTFDWEAEAAAPSIYIFEISDEANELTIENSLSRITGALNGIPNNSPFYYNDAGNKTKFINITSPNNYTENVIKNVHNFQVYGQQDNNIQDAQLLNNASKRNEVAFKDFNLVRFYKNDLTLSNYHNQPDFIIGGYRETGILYGGFRFRPNTDPTPSSGGPWVLSNEDSWGKVKWTKVSDLLSASSWNHIASQNIKMNNFAIVNNPTVPDPANAPGIRLDDEGNVRIGTDVPANSGRKLQVDGAIEAIGLDNNYVFQDQIERFSKTNALSAGYIVDPTNNSKTFNFFDVPTSNFDNRSWFWFSLQNRNNMARFVVSSYENGSVRLRVLNKIEEDVFKVNEDGNDNVSLTMPKETSAAAIGTSTFYYPGDVTNVNDGNYKLVVNGKMRATGLKLTSNYWSDFVFAKDYNLPTLQEVEQHIQEKGHLPNIPSEKEVVEKGVDMLEMAKLQMQKIEELTLYIIEQNKKIEALENKVQQLETKK